MTEDLEEANLILNIVKANGETDIDDLIHLTRRLMESLRVMDVSSITLLRDQDTLQGSKGALLTVGGIVISLLPVAIPQIMEFLQKWVVRNNEYVVRAKVQKGDRQAEITYPANMSPSDLKAQIETIKLLIDG